MQERPGGAQNVATEAATCEEIIDLAADSSDDDETAARDTHAAKQRRSQQAKRKGVLQLPPHPASLGGGPAMLSRPTAMTPAGSGRQGAARKPGDRSYLGAYSAADIAEGRFPAAGSRPAAAEQPGAAAALELPRHNDREQNQAVATADHYHDAYGGSNATYGQRDDRGKGKQPVAEADDYEDDYGGGYGGDRGVASGRWGGGGAEFGRDAGEEEWEEWRDPSDEAGPSYASPQRRCVSLLTALSCCPWTRRCQKGLKGACETQYHWTDFEIEDLVGSSADIFHCLKTQQHRCTSAQC